MRPSDAEGSRRPSRCGAIFRARAANKPQSHARVCVPPHSEGLRMHRVGDHVMRRSYSSAFARQPPGCNVAWSRLAAWTRRLVVISDGPTNSSALLVLQTVRRPVRLAGYINAKVIPGGWIARDGERDRAGSPKLRASAMCSSPWAHFPSTGVRRQRFRSGSGSNLASSRVNGTESDRQS
jgi:hypothetical protein